MAPPIPPSPRRSYEGHHDCKFGRFQGSERWAAAELNSLPRAFDVLRGVADVVQALVRGAEDGR